MSSNPQQTGTIYLVTNLHTGKYYVGQTFYKMPHRWSVHRSEARNRPETYLHKSIARYGEGSFICERLAEASHHNALDALESLWIAVLRANNRACGYNLTSGGEGVKNVTDETRRRMSEAAKKRGMAHILGKEGWAKGKKFTAEHCANLSRANKGKVPSLACRQAVSEANRRRHL